MLSVTSATQTEEGALTDPLLVAAGVRPDLGLYQRSGAQQLRPSMAWTLAVQVQTALCGSFSIRRYVGNVSIVFTATERDIQVRQWN